MDKPARSLFTGMAEEDRTPLERMLHQDTADQVIYRLADKIQQEAVPGDIFHRCATLIKLAATMVKEPTASVGVVFKKDGGIACIHANPDRAKKKAEEYNANPVVPSTGDPDEDAPYTAKTWGLIDVVPIRVK